MNKKDSIDVTKLSRLKKIIASVEKTSPLEVDPDITFEFLMGSCFPSMYDNVMKRINDEHMAGYLEGLEEGKKLTNN